ncbi:MAG: LysE family transporter [Aestuariibaculum sp.]
MDITIIFFLGLIIAFVGVIPPGLLNMSAAKISLKEGYSRGILFSVGVCLTVALQTYLATIFARYLSKHPEFITILERVAFVIFVLITIYFLFIAKKEPKKETDNIEIRSKHSRFFQGIFMAAINIFPIPYHAYMAISLASMGLMNFNQTSIISYVAGVVMGTFVMLYVYIFFFHKIKDKPMASQKNMNYIIGGITGLVSVITLINIIKEL